MNESWFSENFGEFPDDFFSEDVIKGLDLPPENVEETDVGGDWESKFQQLELPSSNILTGMSSGLHDEIGNTDSEVNVGSSIALDKYPVKKENSAETKYEHQPQTSSPVSVLESSGSSFSTELPILHYVRLIISEKHPRSKRSRSRRCTFPSFPSFTAWQPCYPSGTSELNAEVKAFNSALQKQKKKRNPAPHPVAIRKCTHCEVTKTPQWREGPVGPKTLCNACGVRYRSGRLLPEYRPAASPTFVPTLHSNSHKKVLEMRKKQTE